jgi:cyanate permease
MFGSFVLIPTLAEAATSTGYGLGLDATRAGVLLMPGAFAMLVFGPLSGIVGTRLGNKVPLAAGGFLTALGLALLAVAHESQLEIILFSLVMSAGIGLAFAAMPNLIIEAAPAQQTGEATGFNALVRSVGSSLGSQVSATILASSAGRGHSGRLWLHACFRGLGCGRRWRRRGRGLHSSCAGPPACTAAE